MIVECQKSGTFYFAKTGTFHVALTAPDGVTNKLRSLIVQASSFDAIYGRQAHSDAVMAAWLKTTWPPFEKLKNAPIFYLTILEGSVNI